jgi:hypothetical protein
VRRAICFAVATTTLLIVVIAQPAVAKGPTRAVIRGPGLEQPIVLTWKRPSPNDAFADLVARSGIFAGLWCASCRGAVAERPAGSLGPRFTIAYALPLETMHRSRVDHVVQFAYPFAEPDPVTFVRRGQPFYGETTVGGWFVARPSLRGVLRTLGLSSTPAVMGDGSVTAVASATPSTGTSMGAVGALATIVVLGAVFAVVSRRRRSS